MEAVQYKCPNCGGDLKFDPAKQMFACEYCMSQFNEAEVKAACQRNEQINLDKSQEEKDEETAFAEGTNLYSCASCGAQIISDANTAATFCYYCHNPVILQGRLSGEYKPNKVIAFQIDRETALRSFKTWCKKRWFVPSGFKQDQQLEKMTGLYVPFWVADCNVHADMYALGKKTRSWTSGNYRYTETKEFDIHRRATVDFDGIPADGSAKIEDQLMEAIEPFNYQEARPFTMSYLSGFLADKYDVDKAAIFPRIRNRAVQGSDSLLRSTMQGYSSINVRSSATNVLRTDWQYLLMPVWFLTFQYKGKTYEFAINGQTGKQAGTPPLCVSKVLGFCAAIAAAVTVLGTLGGYLLR